MSFCCHSTTVKYTNKNLNSYNGLNVLYVRIDISTSALKWLNVFVKPYSNLLGTYILLFLTNGTSWAHNFQKSVSFSIILVQFLSWAQSSPQTLRGTRDLGFSSEFVIRNLSILGKCLFFLKSFQVSFYSWILSHPVKFLDLCFSQFSYLEGKSWYLSCTNDNYHARSFICFLV